MNINELRVKIDKIDVELVRLFEERMNISQEIAEYKKKNALPIYDEAREIQIINDLLKNTPKEYEEYVEEFIKVIMKLSKEIQEQA